MKQLALIATLAASTATAQTAEVKAGGDTLTLKPHPDHAAQLVYSNSGHSLTAEGTYTLCIEAVCVSAVLNVKAHSPRELLTVTPQDGFIAYPPEAIVQDGDSVTVLILYPMF